MRARCLGLQQERREIVGSDRVASRSEDFAVASRHLVGCLFLQVVSERIIGSDEEPGLAALVQHAPGERMTIRPSIVGPMDRIGGAFCPGQKRRSRTRTDDHLVPGPTDIRDRQRNRRVRQVDDHIDPFGIEPSAGDCRTDIRLVLVVGREHLHLSRGLFGEVLDRELSGDDRPDALEVGIDAGHVVHHAHPRRSVHFGVDAWGGDCRQQRRKDQQAFHVCLPGRAYRPRLLSIRILARQAIQIFGRAVEGPSLPRNGHE